MFSPSPPPPPFLQDKWKLLPAFLQLRGLVKQHIDSYNYFLQVELKQIMMANQKVICDVDPNFFLKYTDIRVGTPSVEEELIISKTTPNVRATEREAGGKRAGKE